GGVAYIGVETGFTGGYITVNVANSNSLTLISGVDSTSIAGKAIALNGSGLAVSVGSLAFIGGAPNFLQLLNAADPTVTDGFIAQFTLTADPFDVAIASGMAFVADGTGGLVVVNYKSADSFGIAPTINLTSLAVDLDPIAPGIQVQEGTIFQVIPTVTDDVQVSRVDLLVNGQLVRSDVAFPWDLLVTTPAISAGGTTLTVRAIATDTGGNATTSAPLTFTVVPDTFAPVVVDTKPANAAKPFFVPSIDVRFNEAIDQSLLNLSGLHLVNLGGDKLFGTGDDTNIGMASFIVRDRGALLSMVPAVELTQGDYRVTVDPAVIADAAGNHIAAPLVVNFTIRPASDVRALSGVPKIFQAPSANVGQDIAIGFPGADSGLLLVVPTMDQSGNPGIVQVGVSHIDANTGQAFFVVPAAAVTGDINTTHIGQLNYSTFPQWTVTRGTVDLIGVPLGGSAFNDVVPGNGLYVDMDGSNSQAGKLESKATFALAPGTYELRFKLAPAEGGTSPTNTVTVSLGGAFSESITRANNANQTFETFVRTITVSSATSGKLIFDQTNPGDNFGLLLDDVKLTNVGTGQVLIQDNFDFNLVDGAIPLQIVPVVTGTDLTFVNATQANFTLSGSGFIEGNGTQYQVGAVSITDFAPASGPDVFSTNTRANLNGLVFTTDLFGAVTVTTAGGTSAPFSVGYTELASVALSGTAAQAGQASANPGQVVIIRGTGLSLSTDLVARYVADNTGVAAVENLNPFYVNATGTEAQVQLP
ncbi:MAG: Ig-like domain-containing protein, partial [Nitrospira sp.]